MRDSNDKLSDLTRAQWDFDVRRRAFEEAQAFSFTDPIDGAEPVLAELSPEQVASIDGFSARTRLQVDFPPEHGGYFATVRDPVDDTEVGVVPKGVVLALADNTPGSGMIEAEAGVPDLTRDPDDGDGWFSRFLSSGQMREIVLDLMPIIGNIRSAEDAYESWRDAYEAASRGDWGAFVAHGGMGALNTIGAIGGPFSGPIVGMLRAGIRRLADETPGLAQVLARRDIGKAADAAAKSIDPIQVQKVLKKTFGRLTEDQKKTVKGIFPNILGTSAERHAIDQLERLGQNVAKQGRATTDTVNVGGKTVKRRHDARIAELERNFFVRGMKAFDPDARSIGVEVKAQSSSFRKQAAADAAMEKDGSIVQKVLPLRYPARAIPEKVLEKTTRGMLAKHVTGKPGGLSEQDVDRIVAGVKRLRRSKGDWVTAEVIVGTIARGAAHWIARNEEEHRRAENRKQGSIMAGIMTGA